MRLRRWLHNRGVHRWCRVVCVVEGARVIEASLMADGTFEVSYVPTEWTIEHWFWWEPRA